MDLLELRYVWAKLFYRRFAKKKLLRKHNISWKDAKGVTLEQLEVMDTLAAYKPKADVLLDIGAHKGKFAKASSLFFKFRHAVLFEPNLALKIVIEEHCKGLPYKFEPTALSDKDGEVSFFVHKDDTMTSIVETDNEVLESEFPWDHPSGMREIPVQTCRLDDYIERNNLQDATFFLKIDTQGNELNVLRHGLKTLEKTSICLIEYMFFTPYKTEFTFIELMEFMEAQGFECRGALSVTRRPSGKVSGVDFFFQRKEGE